jgi:hypothetical protein
LAQLLENKENPAFLNLKHDLSGAAAREEETSKAAGGPTPDQPNRSANLLGSASGVSPIPHLERGFIRIRFVIPVAGSDEPAPNVTA